MEFYDALMNHLEMVKTRNLEGFLSTLVQDHRLILILPNASLLKGYGEVKKFHIDWFSDPAWSMETELMTSVVGSDLAQALLKVDYNDTDEEGKSYTLHYFLSLTFILESGEWRLIMDQNTM